MTELQKTITYGGVAVVLAVLAFVTAPSRVTPDAFQDKNELFFQNFTDPNTATTLEVIEFDEEGSSAVPFKVTFKGGRWTIPSHNDYPADGKDRLAKTAAGIIGIRKNEFRSSNIADHEALGVIDPLDESATALTGRGTRVTLKGQNAQVLADFIMSAEIEGRENYRFVRIPGQKRVYAAKVSIDLSTKFSDWIEPDLLQVQKADIEKLTIKDYSINERTGSLQKRDTIELTPKDDGDWKMSKLPAGREINMSKVKDLLKTLDEMSIVGVRPKPEGLTQSLTKMNSDGISITQEAVRSLQSKGFYFTRDGQLVSNEGEIQGRTKQGVIYTLRFGEVVYGSGLAVTAGTETDSTEGGAGENRYLFITTSFEGSQFEEPPKPSNFDFMSKADSLLTDRDKENKEIQEKHDQWLAKIKRGADRSNELNARFAKWYYVISAQSFDKLHLKRSDLMKEKKAT